MTQKAEPAGAVRVLLLEDLPQDIEIVRELLADSGGAVEMETAATEKDFVRKLKAGGFDVILADFKLPGFDGFAALRLAREICPEIPFICVSGTIGEEKAVEVLKQGAVDYILKDRLKRLPFAIERALDLARESLEHKRAVETLRESEDRYQTLARISPVGIFRTDAEGRTTYVNPRWCQIAGLDAAQAAGFGWLEAVHPDDRERVRRGWENAAGDRRTSYSDYRFLRADGSVSWVMGQAIPEIDPEGRVVGFVGTITEISERKLAEAMIRSSLAEKDILLREVHHRVKNNLQTIICLIQMEEAKTADAALQSHLHDLEGRVRSMALVHSNLYKSDSLARIDMREYVETLSGYIRSQVATVQDVRFHLQAGDAILADLEIAVPCAMILNELLTNAFQHAFPKGLPGAGRGGCEVTVRMGKEEGGCALTVSDNGIGLPADIQWPQVNGTGLKLILMLARQVNGTLQLDRTHGTAFRLFIPDKFGASS
jgi:two-component system response regulator